MAENCNCEHISHMPDTPDERALATETGTSADQLGTGHGYMQVPAGTSRADYVGAICDDCAEGHLAPYVQPEEHGIMITEAEAKFIVKVLDEYAAVSAHEAQQAHRIAAGLSENVTTEKN